MKRTWKTILCLACVFALVASLGIGALAYTDEEIAQIAMDAQRALDIQAVENIMNRHVMYHCYGEHREEVENIWVQEEANRLTCSFGQNQGFMLGFTAVWEGYVEYHDETMWWSSVQNYLANNGISVDDLMAQGWTKEDIIEYYGGVGQLLLHVTTTAIIEVAEDGKTAKGFWYSPGMIKETGQNAQAIWEAYGADFVKEGDEWKIWHLHMYTDFTGGFFVDLGGGSSSGEASASSGESAAAAADKPTTTNAQTRTEDVDVFLQAVEAVPYVSSAEYSTYSVDRLRADAEVIPIPMPYETWDFSVKNYGVTAEQYAANGIDINAWYESQGTSPAGAAS